MKLDGKIALVTGAARGIGRGCALELARAGADVAVNDRERSPAIEAVAAEIEAMGRRAVVAPGNAFEVEAAGAVVSGVLDAFGRIDVLVSNPAYSRRGDYLTYDPETFQQVIQGTLTGGFHVSQRVARHMTERGGGGKILFISSVHAQAPYVRSVAYNAAKAGLNHMMRTIAAELLTHRINVNAIEPGWIDTPGEHETFGDAKLAEEGARLPWGRLGLPADIGKAAVFLCSEDADYVTGTVLTVDGGLLLRGALGAN